MQWWGASICMTHFSGAYCSGGLRNSLWCCPVHTSLRTMLWKYLYVSISANRFPEMLCSGPLRHRVTEIEVPGLFWLVNSCKYHTNSTWKRTLCMAWAIFLCSYIWTEYGFVDIILDLRFDFLLDCPRIFMAWPGSTKEYISSGSLVL